MGRLASDGAARARCCACCDGCDVSLLFGLLVLTVWKFGGICGISWTALGRFSLDSNSSFPWTAAHAAGQLWCPEIWSVECNCTVQFVQYTSRMVLNTCLASPVHLRRERQLTPETETRPNHLPHHHPRHPLLRQPPPRGPNSPSLLPPCCPSPTPP